MNTNEKLSKLRIQMERYGLDAYIIPSADPHLSEYVAEHWKSRSWISGFNGSAGTLVVTRHKSGLWTDGRYYIQAEKQLAGSEIELFKIGQMGTPTYIEWLCAELTEGGCTGFFGKLVSVSAAKEMEEALAVKGIHVVKKYDLISEIWENRPEIPQTPVFNHEIIYTGLSASQKIELVRKEMKRLGASHYLITSLDSIAWLFNIRGNDIPYNPVTISYGLVSLQNAWLFIDSVKLDEPMKQILKENGILLKEYDAIDKELSNLSEKDCILFDPKKTNCWIFERTNGNCKKTEGEDIVTRHKAVKNDTELANLRKCYIKDGTAMVKFLYWLEENLGLRSISELDIAEKLKYFRGQQENNRGPSFDTIAAYKDHAAMMHYKAAGENFYELDQKGLLLIDSGGQYLDGTTDITRTIALGEITNEERDDFTMVLKAHIGLARAKFLYGAAGANLDILARQPLWEMGMDYKCGTGHGVGYFLNVHEGPQGFSQVPNMVNLEKGMVVTNEPGIYKEGKHGIRTENVLVVAEDERTEWGQFMRFEVLSYCPIDRNALNPGLLTDKEKIWLNNYHKMVYQYIAPYLEDNEKRWLANKTQAI